MTLRDEPTLEEVELTLDTQGWVVLRLDGHSFTRRAARYDRPFDPDFHAAMRAATSAVLSECPAAFAHTASDEISLFFPPATNWFAGRLAKWLTTTAGVASSALSAQMAKFEGLPSVDARAFATTDEVGVMDYLAERLRSSERNCRQGYVYYTLLSQGLSGHAADVAQRAMSIEEALTYVPADAPAWQRYGALAYYELVPHEGIDPRDGSVHPTTRRRLRFADAPSAHSLGSSPLTAQLLASRAAKVEPR